MTAAQSAAADALARIAALNEKMERIEAGERSLHDGSALEQDSYTDEQEPVRGQEHDQDVEGLTDYEKAEYARLRDSELREDRFKNKYGHINKDNVRGLQVEAREVLTVDPTGASAFARFTTSDDF